MSKVYETRYYEKRPYCVEVSDNTVEVFEQSWDETNDYWSKDRRVFHSSYERIFIGEDANHPTIYPGNTLLLHIRGSEYVFIGHVIFSFSLLEGDEIIQYVSPSPSGVPTPYAIGKERVYLLNDHYSLGMIKKEPDTPIPFIITTIHTWKMTESSENECV